MDLHSDLTQTHRPRFLVQLSFAFRNLFVPVATTLKEMSSLMGSRVGVKHWRDFAFFQTTGKGESLRRDLSHVAQSPNA